MRLFFITITIIALTSCLGCGLSTGPAEPATLNPEQEQEILDQVEGAAAEEEGKS